MQTRGYDLAAAVALGTLVGPSQVAARVVENMPDVHRQIHAPWMVANFLMKRFPHELPAAPLSWDNVVHGTKGLGYVVSTHQDIRVAPPEKTVWVATT